MPIKFSSKRPLTKSEETEIQKMIANDPDAPEATDEQIAKAKPFRDALPALSANIDKELARRGRPKLENQKRPVTIRLDLDIVEHYKAKGKGWQSLMNQHLRKISGLL